MTGVILAGGRSARMGRDKTQLFREHTLAVLEKCFPETLVITEDDTPGLGPLGGIVTALRRRPEVFVVACDMPFLNADIIRDMAGQLPAYDAVALPREPLHAAYSAGALPAAEAQIATGDYSVHRWLAKLRVRQPDLSRYPDWEKIFFNVNTPADLAKV